MQQTVTKGVGPTHSFAVDVATNRLGRYAGTYPCGELQGAAGAGEPGSWNRFAYVGGDRLTKVDARGLIAEDPRYGDPGCQYQIAGGFLAQGVDGLGGIGGGEWDPCVVGTGLLPNPLCMIPIIVPPPPREISPAKPSCTVELWYRPVAGSGGQNHAYVRVSLTYEGMTSCDQIEGGLEELCDKTGKLYLGVGYIEKHPVQYSASAGSNSNSYVGFLLRYNGIADWPVAPPGSWVWSVPLY